MPKAPPLITGVHEGNGHIVKHGQSCGLLSTRLSDSKLIFQAIQHYGPISVADLVILLQPRISPTRAILQWNAQNRRRPYHKEMGIEEQITVGLGLIIASRVSDLRKQHRIYIAEGKPRSSTAKWAVDDGADKQAKRHDISKQSTMPKAPPQNRHDGNGHAAILPVPGSVKDGTQANRVSRDRRVFSGYTGGMVESVERFLSDYIVLPPEQILVVALWVLASWLADLWDRFPHLAITSPEKRCGKTRLLQLLEMLVRDAYNTTNISPAAIYRLIELKHPTLLLDEAQSISRRGCESSEVIRELLNAGIDRGAKVLRVGGDGHDQVQEFGVYSPKAIALIGDLDGVLADRCLPVCMKRKTAEDTVKSFRSRLVEPIGKKLHDQIEEWAGKNADEIAKVYDELDVFPIENDRLAELLLPLQAVLTVADKDRLPMLAEYASAIDKNDEETESPGVRLLMACRKVFANVKTDKNGVRFLPTVMLISELSARSEEPWNRWTRGGLITAEALANLLRPFGIRSARNKDQSARGFFAHDFQEAWSRYLPPIP